MISKNHKKDDVIRDRKLGMSLNDLSKKYILAKSTVSLWCRNVKLSSKTIELMRQQWFDKTRESRIKGTEIIKRKKLTRIKEENIEAVKILGKLTQRDLFVIGVGLYWAEGSKKEDGSGFSFINSDPYMVKLMISWLNQAMGIDKSQLIIHLVINAIHKGREGKILKFWSNLLDFKLGDFGNTTFIKTPYKRTYSNDKDYYGMVRIKVRSSSWLRRRILGMIKVFSENADVAQVARASHS